MSNEPLKISLRIDEGSAAAALGDLAPALARQLEQKLDRAALEVSRAEREEAPKSFSTLVQSIHIERDGALARWIGPGVAYAVQVALGTGPAAGRPSYFPNVAALEPWVRQHSGVQIGSTRAGTPARQALRDQLRDRTWALARHIAHAGTKPNPFIDRAGARIGTRVTDLLQEGVDAALAQVGRGAGAAA